LVIYNQTFWLIWPTKRLVQSTKYCNQICQPKLFGSDNQNFFESVWILSWHVFQPVSSTVYSHLWFCTHSAIAISDDTRHHRLEITRLLVCGTLIFYVHPEPSVSVHSGNTTEFPLTRNGGYLKSDATPRIILEFISSGLILKLVVR
jgi:hypothetical protein